MSQEQQHLFRDKDGQIKSLLSHVEGISFQESPLDFFILLARYKFLIRFLKKTDTVLDAGCGHGLGSVFLSKYAKTVTGADYDLELVEKNKETYSNISNLDFKHINLLNIDPSFSTYDFVVSMDVIEHFTREDGNLVTAHYANLVKEGGFAVIGTPNRISQPYASQRRKDSHLYEYDPKEFETLLLQSFRRVFLFSMTDETVSTSFQPLAWYLMALCVK